MPSSSIVHAACFAVGAVVGGGTVAALTSRKSGISSPPSYPQAPPVPSSSISGLAKGDGAVMQIGKSGQVNFAGAGAGAVLKYGHPGAFLYNSLDVYDTMLKSCYTIPILPLSFFFGMLGPVSDFFVRKAYVMAYDRRMRHPAWVRLIAFFCSSTLVFPHCKRY
jgi:hypothetical protein